MSYRLLPSIVASLLAVSALGAESAPLSSNPCAGYSSAQYACNGFCVWNEHGDPDEQKTSSFTTEIISSIGYAEVTSFGTQNDVPVSFDYPLDTTTTIDKLTAVVSGFYVELTTGEQIKKIEVKADMVYETVGPCAASGQDSAGGGASTFCEIEAYVTPYLDVDYDGDAGIEKAFIKVAAIGKQVFNACDEEAPIIPWADAISVDLSTDDSASWQIDGISTDGETFIKNYPYESVQPLAPVAFFTGFSLEFAEDHQLRKIVVDPDAGTDVPGVGFQSSMVYDDETGNITGNYQLELEANSYDAVSGSMDLVVLANALQPSPFAAESGTTNWYKPERSDTEDKTIGSELKQPVFFSTHQIAPAPDPPVLTRSWSVEVPSTISFCGLGLATEYVSSSGAAKDCPAGDCSVLPFFSGLAKIQFDLSVSSGGDCSELADGAEGSAKFFLLGQEPIPVEARPFPSASGSGGGGSQGL